MKKKIFIVVLLLIISLFFFSKQRALRLTKLEEGVTGVIYLPARVLAQTSFSSKKILSQRQERLFLEFERENERLRRLLELKRHSTYRSIAALVIGRSPTNWFNTIVLDKGSEAGVAVNMPVITPEGLVGRVNRIGRNSSQVLLITDPESEIGVLLERTRIQGVIQGRKRDLVLKYLPLTSDVRAGDLVITSGLEKGLFPKGLTIGRVKRVGTPQPQDLYLEIVITPEADLSRLEEVLILKTRNESR
jgi:rod shape-determining protein MreC